MSPSLELALDCGAGLGTEGVRVATRRACAGDRANCVSSPAEPQTPRLLRPPHREPFCGRESGILTALVLICDTAVLTKAGYQNGLVLMQRITTFVSFAVFGFLAGSSTALAEQGGTEPARLNAPREQAPVA